LNAVARQVDTTGVISSISFNFTYLRYAVTGVAVDSSGNLYAPTAHAHTAASPAGVC
jgi:hypothetical protein